MDCLIVGEHTLLGDEVEDHLIIGVVADISANQLGIPHHAAYIRSALKEEIPFVSYAVHFFLLECSPEFGLLTAILGVSVSA